MRKSFFFLFVTFLVAMPAAFAVNSRSAVSINGMDTNPCTVASPCRSFTAALAATATDGEVIALDSAGYGPFTISFGVTVSGAPGVHAAITAPAGDGVNVMASTGQNVTIRNLVLIGAGGSIGIEQNSYASNLRVLNCLVRGFSNAGIESHIGKLTVDRSLVFDTPNGIGICGLSNGTDVVEMTITNSLVDNFSTCILATGNASAMIVNCTLTHGMGGVVAESQTGTSVAARVTVESSTIARNVTGVAAISSGSNNTAIVYISQDDISYNSFFGVTGIGAGSSVKSFGNNRFTENRADGGPFPAVALQ